MRLRGEGWASLASCSHEKRVSAAYGQGDAAVASAGCRRECMASDGACSSHVLEPRTKMSTSAWAVAWARVVNSRGSHARYSLGSCGCSLGSSSFSLC